MTSLARRLVNIVFAIDETANAVLGGSPRETISGTVGRAALTGAWWAVWFAQPLINLIMRNPQHCQHAAADEATRRMAGPASS